MLDLLCNLLIYELNLFMQYFMSHRKNDWQTPSNAPHIQQSQESDSIPNPLFKLKTRSAWLQPSWESHLFPEPQRREKNNWFMEKEAENTLFRAEMAK